MTADVYDNEVTSTGPKTDCTDGLLAAKTVDSESRSDEKPSHDDDTNDAAVASKTKMANGLKQKLPIDRGWAWIILAASTLEMFIVVGWFKCGGIFFVELQKRYNSSSSATSLIWSLMNGSFSISAFCVMTFGQSIPSRVAVILGSSVVSLSFVLTAFMPSLQLTYFVHGILTGAFFAFIQPFVLTMLNTYFDKRRGLALNIAGTGVSLGGLAMPPVYTKLFEHFGFTGTYMFAGAFIFHVVLVGALYRPLEYYKGLNKNNGGNRSLPDESLRKSLIYDDHQNNEKKSCGNYLYKDENNETAKKELKVYSQSVGTLYNSVTDLTITKSYISMHQTDDTCKGDKKVSTASTLIKASLAILKKRVFQYYIVVNMMMCCGNVIVESYIAPHAFDMGIDNNYIALLLASISIADICAKVLIGYLSDSKWVGRSTIMALSAGALGMCSFFVMFMNSFPTLVIYAVCIGMLQPVYFTLFSVVAVDLLSLQELKGALGFLSLAQGASNAAMLPIAGYIRDVTGRYFGTFGLAGSLLIASGILCFLLPNVKTYCDRQLRQSHGNQEQEEKVMVIQV